MAQLFCPQSWSNFDTAVMGGESLLLLHSCKSPESLDKQCYQLVRKMTKEKTFFNPERLHPTVSPTKNIFTNICGNDG